MSTFEQEKQRMIVAQSQMERTIELFKLFELVPNDLNEVLALHEILIEIILTGKRNKDRISKFNQHLNKSRGYQSKDLDEIMSTLFPSESN